MSGGTCGHIWFGTARTISCPSCHSVALYLGVCKGGQLVVAVQVNLTLLISILLFIVLFYCNYGEDKRLLSKTRADEIRKKLELSL